VVEDEDVDEDVEELEGFVELVEPDGFVDVVVLSDVVLPEVTEVAVVAEVDVDDEEDELVGVP